MSKRYSKELSLEELSRLDEAAIDTSDIAELDEAFWAKAEALMPEETQAISLRVKKSVLDGFKATGRGYQTRMNAVLEAYASTLPKS
ncbi:BrnA antitoxin family protein [Pelagibacterium luteolum]|uniref:Uncharacterized conserved protein, DUF4415 family n=1 Tax=Pelagibacterium luteolum TaxID=440168 RepID=A0A1G7VIY4_9HYPH|nr:BrnA antitoxin family protein [Pelagibacterium luteolum]SDG59776.1 Uncharacterized conserved protein, DUF4415 family [Pelagibacterium luteolum]